ncbi:MAG: hypothetical protein GDA36_09705, partial [Rhodobacteraceae bacterium]|nr:hypothetical protein [Paracoccaceae bacterium]
MFGECFDLAILSGPLALHRAKRFWWSGYAIAGVCGAGFVRLSPSPVGRFVLASSNYRAVLHRGIGIAQSERGGCRSACPRVVA